MKTLFPAFARALPLGLSLALPFALPFALWPSPAFAQDSLSLASKSIAQVHAVQHRVFAFAEDGRSFSRLNLFVTPPEVLTRDWAGGGGAEGGAPWSSSLLLRANYSNYYVSDSTRVARVTSLRASDATFRGSDSLIFRNAPASPADGASLTALAIRDSAGSHTAVLGFGRLGVAYARLGPETNPAALFVAGDTLVNFIAFPETSAAAIPLYSCRWNRLCRADTLSGLPALDSVISVAIDSSHVDSIWLLVATSKGLRRGLWGGAHFPYVPFPGIGPGVPVRSVFASPSRGLAWAFTGQQERFFFSDDHGASFRVPGPVPGVVTDPSLWTIPLARMPHVAFFGDTSYINFNFTRPGLVRFHRDTILADAGQGLREVLLDAEDGLDLSQGEGDLTMLAVARGQNPAQRVLVAGTTLKGIFFRRLDQPGPGFENLTRRERLRSGLAEVITYPSLFTRSAYCGDRYVRIGYRLGKSARVTITVYNYAMEKVRVVVRNAPRDGGIARSEKIAEDRWDGCDAGGRFVSVGTYYVLVESDQGERSFGKVIVTRGRK